MSVVISWNPEEVIDEVAGIARVILADEGEKGVAQIRKSFRRRGVSRPGRPPAIQSGRLSRDLDWKLSHLPSPTLHIGVHSTNPYAMAQELGSPSRNLRPRPYLFPQMSKTSKRILRRFRKKFGSGLGSTFV